MPYLALFRDFDATTGLPRSAWVASSKVTHAKEVNSVALVSIKSPRTTSHLLLSNSKSDHSEPEWLVLFDVDFDCLDESRVAEIWDKLGRLKELTGSIQAEPPRSLKGMRILESAELVSWEHWFRDLPPAKQVVRRGGGHLDPLRIKISNPRFLASIALFLILLGAGSGAAGASGIGVLGFAAYFLKLIILATMAALAIALPTLASWLDQTRTLALFETLLFLSYEAADGALFAPASALRCVLAAGAIFGVFYAVGKIVERFESNLISGIVVTCTLTLVPCAAVLYLVLWV